jgi:hypothetical protein
MHEPQACYSHGVLIVTRPGAIPSTQAFLRAMVEPWPEGAAECGSRVTEKLVKDWIAGSGDFGDEDVEIFDAKALGGSVEGGWG